MRLTPEQKTTLRIGVSHGLLDLSPARWCWCHTSWWFRLLFAGAILRQAACFRTISVWSIGSMFLAFLTKRWLTRPRAKSVSSRRKLRRYSGSGTRSKYPSIASVGILLLSGTAAYALPGSISSLDPRRLSSLLILQMFPMVLALVAIYVILDLPWPVHPLRLA